MTLVSMADPDTVHTKVCSLSRERAGLDYELGRWLLAAEQLGVPASLGCESAAEYAARFAGFDRREARERLRVARALESLPELAKKLKTGALCWTAVRELTRVVDEPTEREWCEAAEGRTVREVERMVARHTKGDRPTDRPSAEPPRRLPYKVSGPTWAILQEAREAMTRERGGHVDDDELIATLAQVFLARGDSDARDEGRSTYQLALTVCESCRTATQRAGGDEVVVDAAVLERAECDAQRLGRVDAAEPPRATQDIPPRVRRAVIRRHNGSCAVPGCASSAFLDLHHTLRRADGGDHHPDGLIPLCTGHHAAAHEGTLVIRGSYSAGFDFEHADGTPFGRPRVSPVRSEALSKALELLVSMGFKQREAQRMVDRAKPHVGHEAGVEEALAAALRQASLPGRVSALREQRACYVQLVA